jgi:hypothetical protein
MRQPYQFEQVRSSDALPMAADQVGCFEFFDGATNEARTDAECNELPMRSFELAVVFASMT